MRVIKARRLAVNPRRVGVRPRRSAKPKRARNLSPKQIAFFGTKRQRAAVKAKRRKVSRRNPVVLTLGAINPHRERGVTKMARHKRRKVNARRRVVSVAPRRRRRANRRRVTAMNPRRRRTMNPRRENRRRNATRIVVVAPRRHNRRNGRHRNPTLFGNSLGSTSSLKILGGGLVGVAAAKFVPQVLPTSLTSSISGSTIGMIFLSGASALASWWLAAKLDTSFGEGVLFGGLMQTASVALNAFLPNFTIGGVPIALGDLVPGQFVVPQNPLRGRSMAALPAGTPSHMSAPAGSRVTSSGLGRAYPAAY